MNKTPMSDKQHMAWCSDTKCTRCAAIKAKAEPAAGKNMVADNDRVGKPMPDGTTYLGDGRFRCADGTIYRDARCS